MRVNAEDYIVELSNDGTLCGLCFSTYESEWILGDVFMRGWYNIHDHANKRMGFYSFNTADKPFPEESLTPPTSDFVEGYTPPGSGTTDTSSTIFGMDGTTFILIVVGAAVLVIAIVLLVVLCTYMFNLKQKSATKSGRKLSLKSSLSLSSRVVSKEQASTGY